MPSPSSSRQFFAARDPPPLPPPPRDTSTLVRLPPLPASHVSSPCAAGSPHPRPRSLGFCPLLPPLPASHSFSPLRPQLPSTSRSVECLSARRVSVSQVERPSSFSRHAHSAFTWHRVVAGRTAAQLLRACKWQEDGQWPSRPFTDFFYSLCRPGPHRCLMRDAQVVPCAPDAPREGMTYQFPPLPSRTPHSCPVRHIQVFVLTPFREMWFLRFTYAVDTRHSPPTPQRLSSNRLNPHSPSRLLPHPRPVRHVQVVVLRVPMPLTRVTAPTLTTSVPHPSPLPRAPCPGSSF